MKVSSWTRAHTRAWLSEGTASYYQNVLRARAGILPAEDAWQRMHSGFRRGNHVVYYGEYHPDLPTVTAKMGT